MVCTDIGLLPTPPLMHRIETRLSPFRLHGIVNYSLIIYKSPIPNPNASCGYVNCVTKTPTKHTMFYRMENPPFRIMSKQCRISSSSSSCTAGKTAEPQHHHQLLYEHNTLLLRCFWPNVKPLDLRGIRRLAAVDEQWSGAGTGEVLKLGEGRFG